MDDSSEHTESTFQTVYDDIAGLVNSVENPYQMRILKENMETCGNFWVDCKRQGKMDRTSGEAVFALLLRVIRNLQVLDKLKDNSHVLYLLEFMTDVCMKIHNYEDKEDPVWLFIHVTSLMTDYKPLTDVDTSLFLGNLVTFPDVKGATLQQVYKHFTELVAHVGMEHDVDDLVDLINECHATLTKAINKSKISQTAATRLFQNMKSVITGLEAKNGKGRLTTYLLEFLQKILREISSFNAKLEDDYKIFWNVKFLIGRDYHPESIKKVKKKVNAGGSALKPHAELTGGSVRVAGLLCELNALRA